MIASKAASLFLLVLVLVQSVADGVLRRRFDADFIENDVEFDGSISHQAHRELWGGSRQWSWSNLLCKFNIVFDYESKQSNDNFVLFFHFFYQLLTIKDCCCYLLIYFAFSPYRYLPSRS